MTDFAEPPKDDYALIYLEDSDRPLPKTLNPKTRYAYFKTIARGGKSIIQSCKDMHLGRVVCYKSLRPEFRDDPAEQRRLLREARVSAMLQHPNTVPTYELGRDNQGHYYFTMKLVHGYTLREVLDYRDRYDLTQLVDVIVQVAHALDYAHSHRVIHRDIKPENILVGPFGEVLLLDWGLAKVWNADGGNDPVAEPQKRSTAGTLRNEGLTGQGALQGTVTYMSPEQIRRDPDIDYRTDVFSLGAVLYEVLAGRPPVQAETVREASEAILAGPPATPSSHRPPQPVPPLLEQTAMRALAHAPADRLPNCGTLIRLLTEDWQHQALEG